MAKKTTNLEGNLYDKILKENAEQLFLPLVEQKLGIKIKNFHPLQEKLQTTIEREMDFFYEVTTEEGKHLLLHLEFQTTNDPEMIYRTAEYHGMALRLKKLPMEHILVYLGAAKMTMQTALPTDKVFQSFKVIDVHRMDTSTLLASQVPEIILLAVLSDIPAGKVELYLQLIVQQLRLVAKNSNELSRYLKQLIILSRLRKFEDTATKIVKDMPLTYVIETDYLYLQGIEKGLAKGIEQGLEQGLEQGIAKGVEKGEIEGEKKGKLKKAILTTIKMLRKQFDKVLISELLSIDLVVINQIQEQLKQEKKIIARLRKKQTTKKIAKDLKVSEIFIEVLKDDLITKPKKNK